MKRKSKIIKGILIIFLIALIGAGVYAIASQKWKIGNTKNSETTRDEKEDEIGNEENIEEQEPPIDNYVEKLSRSSKRKRRLCNKWSKTRKDKRRSRKANRQSRKIQ